MRYYVHEMLNQAAQYIETYGWAQGGPGTTGPRGHPACIYVALRHVNRNVGDAKGEIFDKTMAFMESYFGTLVPEWNDNPDRTRNEVLATLRALAVTAQAQDLHVEVAEPKRATVTFFLHDTMSIEDMFITDLKQIFQGHVVGQLMDAILSGKEKPATTASTVGTTPVNKQQTWKDIMLGTTYNPSYSVLQEPMANPIKPATEKEIAHYAPTLKLQKQKNPFLVDMAL